MTSAGPAKCSGPRIARVAEAPGLIVAASGDGTLMLLSGDGRSEIVAAIDEPIETLAAPALFGQPQHAPGRAECLHAHKPGL